MLAFNSVSLISLFAILPLISAAPARERRDVSFDEVRIAVEAFPIPTSSSASFTLSELPAAGAEDEGEPYIQIVGQPEQGQVQSSDGSASSAASDAPLSVANAKILAMNVDSAEPSGHWQVYTTSAWIGKSLSGA
jgi:hypothetical protein